MIDTLDEKFLKLTLSMLYMAAWEEESRRNPGQKVLRSWKGYPFKILNELEHLNLISQHRKSRSVVLTEEGKRKAEIFEQKISAILDSQPL